MSEESALQDCLEATKDAPSKSPRIRLEIKAHRFGGLSNYPRVFSASVELPFGLDGLSMFELTAETTASQWLRIRLDQWTHVTDEWLGCRAYLEDINGCPLGHRPVLVFDQPYDIPTHTNFGVRHPDAGAFVVAFRRL